MAAAIHRDANGFFGPFSSYAQLGLQKNIQEHDRNWIEQSGDAILWTVEELPFRIYEQLANPKVVTVALTTLSLYTNSLVFYFSKTVALTKQFYQWMPLPPLWAVRFAAYSFSSLLIIGAALRAYGRFSNEALMEHFMQPPRIAVV